MIIKTVRLEAPSNSAGGKFYIAEIIEAADGFTVDYKHGAVGGSPKSGTKTAKPVATLAAAVKIFDALVKSKIEGESHYKPVASSGEYSAPAVSAEASACIPPRLLNDIDPALIVSFTADDTWWVEIKYDGNRVQLHCIEAAPVLYSARSAKTRAIPKTIADAAARYGRGLVLDGELVGDVLWIFDVLMLDGHDFRDEPYYSRYSAADDIVEALACPSIRIAPAATDHAAKYDMIAAAKAARAEGVVFVNKRAPYESKRPASGGNNLRWKFKASASVIVAGHNVKNSIDVALFCGTSIGTASMNGKGALPAIGEVIEVEYLYCQTRLVQAVYKGTRHDVLPSACLRSQIQFKDGIDPEARA